jgi:folate-binding protein YgfZ
MPVHYGDAAAEYRRTLEAASVFDVSHHGKVEVVGPDAAKFLHNLTTNDIRQLPAGRGCEAFLTTGQARIVAAALIFHALPSGSEAYWLDIDPGMADKVVNHLNRYHIVEQLELTDPTRDFGQLHVAGPKAREILSQAFAAEIPQLADLEQVPLTFANLPVVVRRHDPLGIPGFDLLMPADRAMEAWQSLRQAGAVPAGLDAYEILRVEAGTPVYGLDIDETNLPQEVGRTDRAVSFTKGCFIGQETIARIRTYGHVNRSLIGLQAAEGEAFPHRAKVVRDGSEVGHVTSSVISPRLGAAIALAYVRRGSQEPGTSVEIEMAAGRRSARVVSLPFVSGAAGM